MRTGWWSEVPILGVIFAMFFASAFSWPFAPERIPIHWNFAGEVDRFGGKLEGLYFLPLLAVGLNFLMLLIPRLDPRRSSYEQFAEAYVAIRLMVVLLIAVAHSMIVSEALGVDVEVLSIVPLLTGAVLVLLGNLLGKLRQNWFVGIKTPWTLSSSLSWNRTHRFGGKVMIVQGTIVALSAFVAPEAWVAVTLTIVLGGFALISAYSYIVWRGDPDRKFQISRRRTR